MPLKTKRAYLRKKVEKIYSNSFSWLISHQDFPTFSFPSASSSSDSLFLIFSSVSSLSFEY